MLLSPPRASSDGAWVPGHHAAPDSLPTLTYYSKIGELCGAQPELERIGAHVVSNWLALTVADHKANVTVANLRESLKECEIPVSRHDSWIATISKYLGESGAPAVLKAPRESAPPSVRTNVKKHQRLCPPIGKEIGVEGFWPGCAKALIRASSPSHRRVSEAQAAPGDGPKQWLMQPTTALDRGLPGCSGLPFSLGIKPVTCPVLHPTQA